MAAYTGGDRQSFAPLFARWAPRLHGFFLRSLGDQAAAEDLLQTTFLQVHRARATFRPLQRLHSWMFGIAAHTLSDELRRRHRAPLASEEAQGVLGELPAPLALRPLEEAERAKAVREALDRLPEAQRAVLYLHRWEEMSFAEIAGALGTTEGAIKLRAFRAYQRLRTELGALVTEERAA